MKATVTVERTAVVTVGDVDLGRFEVKSSWEGFHKLVNASGEVLILTNADKSGGFAKLFGSIFGVEGEKPDDYLVVRASPSLNARMPKQASPTTPATAVDELSRAALDVLAERRRQVEIEGWTPEHDDRHDDGSLACAASCYASAAAGLADAERDWPWDGGFKPATPYDMLVKAGALVLAELERIDREEARHA